MVCNAQIYVRSGTPSDTFEKTPDFSHDPELFFQPYRFEIGPPRGGMKESTYFDNCHS